MDPQWGGGFPVSNGAKERRVGYFFRKKQLNSSNTVCVRVLPSRHDRRFYVSLLLGESLTSKSYFGPGCRVEGGGPVRCRTARKRTAVRTNPLPTRQRPKTNSSVVLVRSVRDERRPCRAITFVTGARLRCLSDKGVNDRSRGTVARRLPNVPSLTSKVSRIVLLGVVHEETGRNFENPRVRNVGFVFDRSFAFAWRPPAPYNTRTRIIHVRNVLSKVTTRVQAFCSYIYIYIHTNFVFVYRARLIRPGAAQLVWPEGLRCVVDDR